MQPFAEPPLNPTPPHLDHPRPKQRCKGCSTRGGQEGDGGGGAAGPCIPPQVSTSGLCHPPPPSPFPTASPRLVPMPAQQRRSKQTPPGTRTHQRISGHQARSGAPTAISGHPQGRRTPWSDGCCQSEPLLHRPVVLGCLNYYYFSSFSLPPPASQTLPIVSFPRETRQRGDKEVSARQNPRSAQGGGGGRGQQISAPHSTPPRSS